jgi:hypothetical protein
MVDEMQEWTDRQGQLETAMKNSTLKCGDDRRKKRNCLK